MDDLHELIKRTNHPNIRDRLASGYNFLEAYQIDPTFRECYRWLCNCADGGGERGD